MLKHAKTSTAGPAIDPVLVGGDDWNADHVADAAGIALAASTSAPAAPPSGTLQLWARTQADQPLVAQTTPDGQTLPLQPFLGRKRVALWLPEYTGNFAGFGATHTTGNGNVGGASPLSNARYYTTLNRSPATSTSTAGSVATHLSSGVFWRSSVARAGGWRLVLRWGCGDAASVATARSFAGLIATLPGNANPSTRTDLVGIGSDGGDTNLSVIVNDNSGVATKIPLGASFPDHTLSTDAYELVLTCGSNPRHNAIGLELTRLNTGDVYRTTLTADLPSVDTQMFAVVNRANGTTALPVRAELIYLYAELET
jgi:hypothetical protein